MHWKLQKYMALQTIVIFQFVCKFKMAKFDSFTFKSKENNFSFMILQSEHFKGPPWQQYIWKPWRYIFFYKAGSPFPCTKFRWTNIWSTQSSRYKGFYSLNIWGHLSKMFCLKETKCLLLNQIECKVSDFGWVMYVPAVFKCCWILNCGLCKF